MLQILICLFLYIRSYSGLHSFLPGIWSVGAVCLVFKVCSAAVRSGMRRMKGQCACMPPRLSWPASRIRYRRPPYSHNAARRLARLFVSLLKRCVLVRRTTMLQPRRLWRYGPLRRPNSTGPLAGGMSMLHTRGRISFRGASIMLLGRGASWSHNRRTYRRASPSTGTACLSTSMRCILPGKRITPEMNVEV